MVSVILFIGQLVALGIDLNLGAMGFGVTHMLFVMARAVGLAPLFLPASNAWFPPQIAAGAGAGELRPRFTTVNLWRRTTS